MKLYSLKSEHSVYSYKTQCILDLLNFFNLSEIFCTCIIPFTRKILRTLIFFQVMSIFMLVPLFSPVFSGSQIV